MNAAIWEGAQPPSGCSFAPHVVWENIAHLLISKHPPVSYKSPWKPWSDWNTIRLPIKGPLWSLFSRKLAVKLWGEYCNYPNLPPTSATPQKNRENSPGRPRLGTNPGEAPGIFFSWRKTRGYLQCLQNASWVSWFWYILTGMGPIFIPSFFVERIPSLWKKYI